MGYFAILDLYPHVVTQSGLSIHGLIQSIEVYHDTLYRVVSLYRYTSEICTDFDLSIRFGSHTLRVWKGSRATSVAIMHETQPVAPKFKHMKFLYTVGHRHVLSLARRTPCSGSIWRALTRHTTEAESMRIRLSVRAQLPDDITISHSANKLDEFCLPQAGR